MEALAETTTVLTVAQETVAALNSVIGAVIIHIDVDKVVSLSSFIPRTQSLGTDLVTAREGGHVSNMLSISHQIK